MAQTTKTNSFTEVFSLIHEKQLIFLIQHPRSSNVIIADFASFQKLFNLNPALIDQFKNECAEKTGFTFADYSITILKDCSQFLVYSNFCNIKYLLHGNI